MPEIPTLAEVLETHQLAARGMMLWCDCGWSARANPMPYELPAKLHREHIAEMYREARTIRTGEALAALQDWVVVKEDPEHGDGRILTRDRYFKSGWDSRDERDHFGVDPPDLPALVLHTPRDEASR